MIHRICFPLFLLRQRFLLGRRLRLLAHIGQPTQRHKFDPVIDDTTIICVLTRNVKKWFEAFQTNLMQHFARCSYSYIEICPTKYKSRRRYILHIAAGFFNFGGPIHLNK